MSWEGVNNNNNKNNKGVYSLKLQWGIKDYVNMQTKNLVSNRDASKIGKILVFKFPSDFGIKN